MKTNITRLTLKILGILVFVSGCTKNRPAELPEDLQANVYAISEFGATSETSTYNVNAESIIAAEKKDSVKVYDTEETTTISSDEVSVPERLKFMFDLLPISNQASRQFKITFAIDKDYVTSYKIVSSVRELTVIEKALATTAKEVQLLTQTQKASASQLKILSVSQKTAEVEKEQILAGKKEGALLVPLFKYKIENFGVLERTKNELKESTSVLTIKKTDWKEATHIQISSLSDARLLLGMSEDQKEQLNQLYIESKVDKQVLTAEELQDRFSIGTQFILPKTKVLTRLDDTVMHIYEITTKANLNENQLRLLNNKAGNQEILSCQDSEIASVIKSTDKDCVIVLKADLPINYKAAELAATEEGNSTTDIKFKNVPRSQSIGLVEVLEDTAAKQVDISGTLDPNSAVKINDLKGEFFYRRTFEAASNMFLGRTGTSGDMVIVKFELEDNRLVVRNQQSLIAYTGQGPQDREEMMSFPVKYIRMNSYSANGTKLTIPVSEETTKEKAEYILIDWTKNTVPDSTSPLSFFSGGDCFYANSSQRVTATDMRLATDGVLNFSLSGSYTVKPTNECVALKDVNSAYWAGTYQFNYNIVERISFMKRKDTKSDAQFSQNISSMAQAAFNFGVFTLADKVTGNGTFTNHDGSEKYMPMIHDFRNGKKIKYYIGGLNNPTATSPERRKLMIEATQQVITEWNQTLRYAFRGTSLERDGDYVDVVVDEGENTGHLGDLDRNYIWYQELPAENGLLGVAQPAANPRSGAIESANVIIYSGNSYDQAERLINLTSLSRQYEKLLESKKTEAVELAEKAKTLVQTKELKEQQDIEGKTQDGQVNTKAVNKIAKLVAGLNKKLDLSLKALEIENSNIKKAIKNLKMKDSALSEKKALTKELFKDMDKGQIIDYPLNEKTFHKKLVELSLNKDLINSPHRFELAVNNAYMKYAGLDESTKALMQKRSELLAAAVKFDESNKNRPGCFMYARNDINDEVLSLDKDPKVNLLLNYKKVIMSTLSHELGHAFGLLHNFKASIDKANYEFGNEKTGRNYSSIMDYIADTDMHYAGPGPYDAHALRAAYTGVVEVSEAGLKKITDKAKVTNRNLVSTVDIAKAMGMNSFVHFTKDTVNPNGILRYFEQCDDGGLSEHVTCAQFDSGGSASEIVQNLIQDYNRSYINKNFVFDKILFSWPQKIQVITRNIGIFQNIRRYLDEAVMSYIYGTGRTESDTAAVQGDLANAAKLGYVFFHELIRTPNAPSTSISDIDSRLNVLPYSYVVHQEDGTEKEVQDMKVLEARSLYDVNISREKIDTIGIGYDKAYALTFLMQSTAAQTNDDSRTSNISYLDFEQWFLGVSDPSKSLTLNTILSILNNNLQSGFFAPSNSLDDLQFIDAPIKVDINRTLSDQSSMAAVIGLNESKWKGFDPFAESFKVARAFVKQAPEDRINVAKAGQDRNKADTRVFYATQNGVASDVLIQQVAKSELFLNSQSSLYPAMKAIFTAENAYLKPVYDAIQAACTADDQGQPKNADACATAQQKPLDEYLKEIPEAAALKQTADATADKLVKMLKVLNAKNVIMTAELDTDESPINFAKQVEYLRGLLLSEVNLVSNVLQQLEQTPPEQIEATIQSVVKVLQESKIRNEKLESFPLLLFGQKFITEMVSSMQVKLQGNNGSVSGATIAKMMMNGSKMKEDYDQQLQAVDDLSLFTGYIDPDTVQH